MIDDSNIVSLLKEHNQKGLEIAIKKYSRMVYTIIRNIIQEASVQDVEECASDVFLSLWQSANAYNYSTCSLKTWIITLSRRRAIDMYRKLCKYNNKVSIENDIPAKDMGPDEYMILVEDINELYSAINLLNKDERILFYKRYYLFQSCVNIATEQNIKPETVRKQLWKVRQKLINSINK
jgi:RNA polymerase sigma-70 factor (ECF subfamily)